MAITALKATGSCPTSSPARSSRTRAQAGCPIAFSVTALAAAGPRFAGCTWRSASTIHNEPSTIWARARRCWQHPGTCSPSSQPTVSAPVMNGWIWQ